MKDLISTAITLVIAGSTYALYKGVNVTFLQNSRLGLVIFLLVWLYMCASSGTPVNEMGKSPMILLATILGIGAFLIFIWGIITGQKTALIVLGVDIVLLWALSTFRHVLAK